MKIEAAEKLNKMEVTRNSLLVRIISREMPSLRIGEVLRGEIQHLSTQRAVIQLPSGKITVERQYEMQVKEQVRVRLVRQHPVQQLEVFRVKTQPPTDRSGSNQPLTAAKNTEQIANGSRPNRQGNQIANDGSRPNPQGNPVWSGTSRHIITGGQSLQPRILYHGQVMESAQGRTMIRLDQGNLLKLGEAPALISGQKVLLQLAEKVGATADFIKLMVVDPAEETPLPLLKQGQELITRVLHKLDESPRFKTGSKTSLQLPGKISGPPLTEAASMEGDQPAGQPAFKQGQHLISRVVQRLPSGKILIELQGQRFEANTLSGISENDHVLLRVRGIRPHPEFDILDRIPNLKTRAIQLLRNLLINRTSIGTDMMNLHKTLNTVMSSGITLEGTGLEPDLSRLSSWLRPVLDSSKPPDSGLLKKMILDGGQNYEPKLAASTTAGQVSTLLHMARQDLKALLMQLLGKLEHTPGNIATQKLSSLTGQALSSIESAQASNLLAQLHGNGLRFEIPFALSQQPATLYLSISPDHTEHAGSNKKRGYGVLFLLDLEAAGEIRIDAYLHAKTFRSTIYLEQAATLNFFKKAESLLQDRLEALGFNKVLLDFKKTSLLNPEKREAFKELSTGVPRTVNLLDTRG